MNGATATTAWFTPNVVPGGLRGGRGRRHTPDRARSHPTTAVGVAGGGGLIDPPAGPGRPPAAPPAELATYIGVGVSEVLYERVRRDADISLDMSQAGPE